MREQSYLPNRVITLNPHGHGIITKTQRLTVTSRHMVQNLQRQFEAAYNKLQVSKLKHASRCNLFSHEYDFVYLSASMSVCLPICLSACWSVFLSICSRMSILFYLVTFLNAVFMYKFHNQMLPSVFQSFSFNQSECQKRIVRG